MIRNLLVMTASMAAAASSVEAGEVYAGIGLPGVMIGYAQPINPMFTVRGDFATLGSKSDRRNEEGIEYDAKIALDRVGVFGDWFVTGGGFRLTGGVTFNRVKADLHARGDGTPYRFGDLTVPSSPDDRFDVKVEYPKTTPYLGIGYGHQLAQNRGWGFVFDVGASIGKAKVTESRSGPNFSLVPQSEIDKELAEVRDGVAKFKAIPQISVGVNYRF